MFSYGVTKLFLSCSSSGRRLSDFSGQELMSSKVSVVQVKTKSISGPAL